jgi:ribose transport system ATP-binding protein
MDNSGSRPGVDRCGRFVGILPQAWSTLMPASVLAVRTVGLTKSFPGVLALKPFDLDVAQGEVHALVGQNGAGKSTLIKLLAGAYHPDSGVIEIAGEHSSLSGIQDAARKGISVIHQDLNLIPEFSVAENVHLGLRPQQRLGFFVNWPAMRRRTAAIMKQLGVEIDPRTPVNRLSVAQQQMVAIARALLSDPKVLIMDEPTAALGAHEAAQVFRLVRQFREQGRSVIYVSHRLEEITALADRITVMRDGTKVGTFNRSEIGDRRKLVELIIGRSENDLVQSSGNLPGAVIARADGLAWRDRVKPATFEIRRGEVTGVAGLVGAGRSELAALLFGSVKPTEGTLEIDGKIVRFGGPGDAIQSRIALLPEDRRGEAAVVSMTLRENLTLASLSNFSTLGFMSRSRERKAFEVAMAHLKIKARDSEMKLSQLSGGNQQKVVIAKWLETDAELIIFDEPTQGIDVGAQEDVHRILRQLAADGKAVVLISSDLEETVRVSDRVLVMRAGQLVADLSGFDATVPVVLAYCFGEEPKVESRTTPDPTA